MVYKCKNCDSALRYDPASKIMVCNNCGSTFHTEEMNSIKDSDEMMELDIYSCTTCGAELAVNDVEASTFCAYCGQPTIVFNRISQKVKPAYIIPFQIDREQAERMIRKSICRGFFIPRRIRNFEPESLHGIYIPFWLFDIYHHDKQLLRGKDQNSIKYFYREGEVEFEEITADASRQFTDESSQRLEPYDIGQKMEFNPGFMAGFYADCCDVTREEALDLTLKRIGRLYDQEIIKTVKDVHSKKIMSSHPENIVRKSDYIMLPAWFMTLRYKNEPYTIIMNGQTGKIIGALPFYKSKFFALYLLLSSVLTSILFPAWYYAYNLFFYDKNNRLGPILLTILIMFYFFTFALSVKFGKYYFYTLKSIFLTRKKQTNEYVTNRQEDK